jgi:hypothetical protein
MSSDRQLPKNYYPSSGQQSTNGAPFSAQNHYSYSNFGANNGGLQNNLPSFQPSFQVDPN